MSRPGTRPSIRVFNDPGCPYGYSASPALRVLEWRYGGSFDWELVMLGLSDSPADYERKGLTPVMFATGQTAFRDRSGMPFGAGVKTRMWATGPACRAVIATRTVAPGREWAALRALQFAHFTTDGLLDDHDEIAGALATWAPGVDAAEVVALIDSPEVVGQYETGKDLARQAAGTAAELQGKTATDGDRVRFTAPSLVIADADDSTRLVAGGFQPLEAYDVVIANLPGAPAPRQTPDSPLAALGGFPDGLTTREVATLLAPSMTAPDHAGTERALFELVADGAVERRAIGTDSLWTQAASAEAS